MSPECIPNRFGIQTCLAHRFRLPLGCHFDTKSALKKDSRNKGKSFATRVLLSTDLYSKNRPGSELKPINARQQKVYLLLLFTVVLKTSSLAERREYTYGAVYLI